MENTMSQKQIHPPIMIGKENPMWKGNKVGYCALHDWLERWYGKAFKCENKECKTKNPKKYQWANMTGKYKRDRNDFKMLCINCHNKMDRIRHYGNKCNRGHEFTQENSYIHKKSGKKGCRICRRMHTRKSQGFKGN